MNLEQLEQLLRARFAGFAHDHAPLLETHPEQLAEVPAPVLPTATWTAMAERGALALLVPRDQGGLGLGHTAVTMVAEWMGAAGFPAARYLDTLLGLELLRRCRPSVELTDLVKEVSAGRHGLAVAHRHADGGGTPDELPSTAHPEEHDDRVVLTARRGFVVSADEADTLLLLGDSAQGFFLLPATSPSLLLEARSTLGQRRLFDIDVYQADLPRSAVLELGAGGDPAVAWRAVLATARVWQAAYLTGLASGALDTAVQYAKSRHQFGRPLGRLQSIAFRLAASSARVHATRLLVRDAAMRADKGEPIETAAIEALGLAAEVSRTVTAEAVHVHGAFGMTLQSSAQRFFRDVGMESIWLGTLPELRRVGSAG